MTTDKEAVATLRRAARKYAAAEAKRQDAKTELDTAIKAADDAGVARNEIQRLAGISRVTLYRVFDK